MADLTKQTVHQINDMHLDSKGRGYVGDFGFALFKEFPPKNGCISLVDHLGGEPKVACSDMAFANGMAMSQDEKTLIVAETLAARLTAFDVDSSTGALSNRRIWADIKSGWFTWLLPRYLTGLCPDGISQLDSDGGIWVACVIPLVVRVKEGGVITHRINLTDKKKCSFACQLGGPEGKTLFICCAPTSRLQVDQESRESCIVSLQAPFPFAGFKV